MTLPWTIPGFLTAADNSLLIDGVSASELAREYGTPLFVFSERRIAENIASLRRAGVTAGVRLKICYASKANSNLSIISAVKNAGADIEVNSGGELFKALQAGFDPGQIIFNGTSKDEIEIREAVESGIYAIQADSLFELELIEKAAERTGKTAKVSLRLVPEIRTGTLHGLQTALLTSKFGMMPDEAVAAFRRWPPGDPRIDLRGIHIHVGSQTPSAQPYIEALDSLYEEAKRIFVETGARVSHLNLGGGFPVNYLRDDSHADQLNPSQRALFSAELDVAGLLKGGWERVLGKAAAEGHSALLTDSELLIEPGRSVIADAGICLTTVRNRKKRSLGEADGPNGEATDTWLLTDAGFNILLSMETYKWYYHIVAASRAEEPHCHPYRMAGPLCDGGDVYFDIEGLKRLPDHRLLPEGIGPGETLALLHCGAYSVAQMYPYNGRPLPAIALVGSDGKVRLARKRDCYEDLLYNERP